MADIGDDYTSETLITDLDGAALDPSTVSVLVTAPDGTTSTPTVTNPAAGTYRTTFNLTAAGRWLIGWTTTGPAGVDYDYVDVDGDPPEDRLQALATVADVEDLLGRDLTAVERRRCRALLRSMSNKIRAVCLGVTFDYVEDDAQVITPVGTILRLPATPVVEVSSVTAVGSNGIPDTPITGWSFNGLNEINVAGISSDIWVSLPAWWDDLDRHQVTYRVVYTHGYRQTPDLVADICAGGVIRVLTSPSATEGMVSQAIGQYNYQMGQAMGAAGASPRLTRNDLDMLQAAGFIRESATTPTPLA